MMRLTSTLFGNRTIKHLVLTISSSFGVHDKGIAAKYREFFTQGETRLQNLNESNIKNQGRNVLPQGNSIAEMIHKEHINITSLLQKDFEGFYYDIHEEFRSTTKNPELLEMACYYADGKGKAIRPMLVALVGKAINYHLSDGKREDLLESQSKIAMVVEMIHIASLMHDDLIDREETRRGKASMAFFGDRKVVRAGSFVTSVSSMLTSRIGNNDVTLTIAQIVADLVRGELAQLDTSYGGGEDMWSRYLNVTYLKAGTLFSNASKAVALLSGADHSLCEGVFLFGRNVGMAFQISDDILDIEDDMRLGIATAPVLLACEKYPELKGLLKRRCSEAGDFQRALELVQEAKSLEESKQLVWLYCDEADRELEKLRNSPYKEGLQVIANTIKSRIQTI